MQFKLNSGTVCRAAANFFVLQSHKLQFLAFTNYIKRKNINKISITIIPSHCYYLYNLYCKPNIYPDLLKEFNDVIVKDLKLSENIKPIFQQGSIVFSINSPKLNNFQNIYINSDILQFSILKYIQYILYNTSYQNQYTSSNHLFQAYIYLHIYHQK